MELNRKKKEKKKTEQWVDFCIKRERIDKTGTTKNGFCLRSFWVKNLRQSGRDVGGTEGIACVSTHPKEYKNSNQWD